MYQYTAIFHLSLILSFFLAESFSAFSFLKGQVGVNVLTAVVSQPRHLRFGKKTKIWEKNMKTNEKPMSKIGAKVLSQGSRKATASVAWSTEPRKALPRANN